MAATITDSGTWSTIATAERPTTQGATIDERYDYDSLVYEEALKGNTGGFPELEQFIGLMANAYDITGLAAATRLLKMLEIRQNRGRTPEEREYTP